MSVLKVIWKLAGVGAAIRFFYYSVMFAGALLNINDAPVVNAGFGCLAFLGATLLLIDQLVRDL